MIFRMHFNFFLTIILVNIVSIACAETKEIKYQIKFIFPSSALSNSHLEKTEELLLKVSEAERLIDKPNTSTLVIKSRARKDITLFKQALNSRGYYDVLIDYKLDKNTTPLTIKYQVDLGLLYEIGDILLIKLMSARLDLDLGCRCCWPRRGCLGKVEKRRQSCLEIYRY